MSLLDRLEKLHRRRDMRARGTIRRGKVQRPRRYFVKDEHGNSSMVQGEGRMHYWLVSKDSAGHSYLIYGATTESEARSRGLEMLGTNFIVKPLPTRDQARASQLLKGHKLEESHNIDESVKRLRHKPRGRY